MLMILSPSKRQRFSGSPVADPVQENLFSRPEWIARAGKVAQIMKSCAPHELARILHASDTIAATEAGISMNGALRPLIPRPGRPF